MQVAITTRLALGAALLFSAGCSYAVQTTSGQDYLADYADIRMTGVSKADDLVRELAAVEPMLQFPARIGIARVDRGELSPVPAAEAVAWAAAAERLGPTFGAFVPVNALVAEMVSPTPPPSRRAERLRHVVDKIRLGAARQHLDAVLIYETHYTAAAANNALSIADWTILGAFMLPGQSIDATAFGTALLVDVRNGYPYGTADVVVDRTTLSTTFAQDSASAELGQTARRAAALLLIEDVEQMMRDLKLELTGLAELDADWTP